MIKALVIRTAGTNCDQETMHALETCGAKVDLRHLRDLEKNKADLKRYSILVIPGGFSYGDDVAAGKILANELKFNLREELDQFVKAKKLVIGICNGFQVLAKAGLLPGGQAENFVQTVTLAQNDSGRFQCEWVPMKREKSKATWLSKMPQEFDLPIAHGEGKFIAKNSAILKALEKNQQIVFRYQGKNPNGSTNFIAGICNPQGNVVGLMPHPERYFNHHQHPAWARTKEEKKTPGYLFWQGAVQYARNLQ